MIEIKFYNNGYEIFGHAEVDVCSAISAMAWIISNTIYHIDDTANGVHDNPGYTHSYFDVTKDKVKFLYDELKHNIAYWITELGKNQAKITYIDKDFKPKQTP